MTLLLFLLMAVLLVSALCGGAAKRCAKCSRVVAVVDDCPCDR